MFGYVVVNKPELKIREFDTYQSFYCGLCGKLKDEYGRFGQIALNFDMTFLEILLCALYECEETTTISRCVVHPIHKHVTRHCETSAYAADMTIVLTYLKCLDDWQDEHKTSAHLYMNRLHKKYERIKQTYPEKVAKIEAALKNNQSQEEQGCHQLDVMASYTGVLLGEIFAYKEDEWKERLYQMGEYLGRFIYLMDAYDDLQEDKKNNQYNPLSVYEERSDFDDWVKEILEMMMAQCCDAFEALPILEHTGILRNILYSGVWAKYETVKKKRLGDNCERSV